MDRLSPSERERIVERVGAGLERARTQGKRLGRPRGTLPLERETVAHLSVTDAAAALGVSRATIKRWRRAHKTSRRPRSFRLDSLAFSWPWPTITLGSGFICFLDPDRVNRLTKSRHTKRRDDIATAEARFNDAWKRLRHRRVPSALLSRADVSAWERAASALRSSSGRSGSATSPLRSAESHPRCQGYVARRAACREAGRHPGRRRLKI